MKRPGTGTAEARTALPALQQGTSARALRGETGSARGQQDKATHLGQRVTCGAAPSGDTGRGVTTSYDSGRAAEGDEPPLHDNEERLAGPPGGEMKPPAPH